MTNDHGFTHVTFQHVRGTETRVPLAEALAFGSRDEMQVPFKADQGDPKRSSWAKGWWSPDRRLVRIGVGAYGDLTIAEDLS